jgi:hypothetical protein
LVSLAIQFSFTSIPRKDTSTKWNKITKELLASSADLAYGIFGDKRNDIILIVVA